MKFKYKTSVAIFFALSLNLKCIIHAQSTWHLVFKSYIVDLKKSKKERLFPDGHCWVKDSFVVVENVGLNFFDSLNVHKQWDEVVNYVFFNLRKKQFYEYLHFSDSAILQTSYDESGDSKRFIGSKFYREHPGPAIADSASKNGIYLTDTIINNKAYQRYRYSFRIKETRTPFTLNTITLYFDCNSKMPVYHYKWLSERKGCQVVAFDIEREHYFIHHEIQIASNELTTEQSKAFNAWEKYAKEHPVK